METVVIYSTPGIGHLVSTVELGKLLLTQNPSLSITILLPTFPFNTGSYSSYISSVSSLFPSISFHYLPVVPLRLGEPSKYSDIEQVMFEILESSNSHVKQFLQSLVLSSHVSAFILDLFCYSSLDIAESFNIPTYIFFTSNAAVLALFFNLPVFDKILNGGSFRDLGTTMFEIPGLFSVPGRDMLEPMLDRGASYDGFVKMGAYLPKCNGIIVNTFELLEPRAFKSLKDGTCLSGSSIPPVYCVGTLIANQGIEYSAVVIGEEEVEGQRDGVVVVMEKGSLYFVV